MTVPVFFILSKIGFNFPINLLNTLQYTENNQPYSSSSDFQSTDEILCNMPKAINLTQPL